MLRLRSCSGRENPTEYQTAGTLSTIVATAYTAKRKKASGGELRFSPLTLILSSTIRVLNEIFSRASEGSSTTIKWSDVEFNHSHCENDVLRILDICFAATAGITGNTELLAATGIGEITRRPGNKSFISRAMATMSDMQGNFNVSMLHGRPCDRRYRIAEGQTLIHIQRSDRGRVSSVLLRLSTRPPMPMVAATPFEVRAIKEHRALIPFTLNADSRTTPDRGMGSISYY